MSITGRLEVVQENARTQLNCRLCYLSIFDLLNLYDDAALAK